MAQPFRLFFLPEPGSGGYPAGWYGGSHNAPQFALLTMREPGNCCGDAEECWTSASNTAGGSNSIACNPTYKNQSMTEYSIHLIKINDF